MKKVVLSLGLAVVLLVSACSRQQSDWEKTRTANTTDAYELFLKKYPNGEFAAQAQARLKELYEERDWQKARDLDSAEAYQAFLKQYPEGKWAEEARIRVENFTLAAAPSNTGATPAQGAASPDMPASPASPAPSSPAGAAVPKKKPVKSPDHAPVAAAKPSGHAGRYGVQLGAFKTGAAAATHRWHQLANKYPKLLGDLSPKVTPRQEASGTMYRLQVGSLSEQQAHAICKTLKAHAQGCMVIAPEH